MRSLVAISFVSLLSICSAIGIDFEDLRECPTGYFYAGDDTKEEIELKSYWKIATTPVYSCYKRLPGLSGINEGLEKCYNSVSESDNMEARVVSFEGVKEVERVFDYMLDNRIYDHHSNDPYFVLTSAISFKIPDTKDPQWIYLGTNYTQINITEVFEPIPNPDSKQCLALRGVPDDIEDETTTTSDVDVITKPYQTATAPISWQLEWIPIDCVGQKLDVLCEIRVETVTYAWVPNWLTITLLVLTIVLLVTCCMAAMSYKQHQPRAYRGNGAAGVTQGPANDLPPKYSEVTGIGATNQDQGTFEKYKTKGKDILAKIYVVRDK